MKHLRKNIGGNLSDNYIYIMNMKKISSILVLALMALMLASCGSTKNIAYFQNSDSIYYEKSRMLYDAHIMPKDQLTITVSTTNQEAAVPFNLTVPTPYTMGQRTSTSQPALQSYLVDNQGYITFPIIGSIKVGGLTKSEAERMILEKIRPYMAESENPIVTVRMSSYSVSVIGEVNRPGSFQVSREKITILEALAQAGDLTIYGVRNKVKLIREDATGKKEIYTLNLNDANIVNSPYYYLQQNDVVYVEPNKVKAQNSSVGSMTTLWFSATSIVISLASLLYNILK
jgi:polysaccharide export outer membrane protein